MWIEKETVGVVAYLHYASSTPNFTLRCKIYKSTLRSHFDFRALRIVPLDHSQITTLLQGTLGYLDSEYLQTSVLIEKSVLYSFTIVLAELLTKRKHYLFPMYFVSSMKEDCLLHIIDGEMLRTKGSFHNWSNWSSFFIK